MVVKILFVKITAEMQQHEGARMSFGQSASPMQTPMKDQGISSLNYTPLASTAEPGNTNFSLV